MDRISRADCTGSSAGGRIDRRVECATMSAQTENRMLERTSFAQQNTSDCIARARALAPLIAAHAERTEQEREIASEVQGRAPARCNRSYFAARKKFRSEEHTSELH